MNNARIRAIVETFLFFVCALAVVRVVPPQESASSAMTLGILLTVFYRVAYTSHRLDGYIDAEQKSKNTQG